MTLLVRCAELNCCSHHVNGVCADPVVTSGQQVPKDPFGPNICAPGPRSLGVPLPLTVPGLWLEKEGRVWTSSWHPHSCFAQLPVGSGARPGLPPISPMVPLGVVPPVFPGGGWNFKDGFPSFLPQGPRELCRKGPSTSMTIAWVSRSLPLPWRPLASTANGHQSS